MCVCDYRFSDEGLSEVIDRLKEMLDMDAAEKDLDIRRETPAEVLEGDAADGRTSVSPAQCGWCFLFNKWDFCVTEVCCVFPEPTVETAEALQSKRNYFGKRSSSVTPPYMFITSNTHVDLVPPSDNTPCC